MMYVNKTHIKVILIGESGVGKSAIIQRYYEDKFKENTFSTHCSNYLEKEVTINDEKYILELWDTAGQEEYRSVNKIFVKNSKIIILVYDVTSFASFESLKFWYDYIIKELGTDIILGLAGNKTDLIFEDNFHEEVSAEKGKALADKIGASFACVSAKESAYEIKVLFNELLARYLDIKTNYRLLSGSIKLDSSNFTGKVDNYNECCFGKNEKKAHKLKAIFLGNNGVGKTSIIKAIKGKKDIKSIAHTKKEYEETINYKKNAQYITVTLKEITEAKNIYENIENDDGFYKIYFLVFDINRIETLYTLENYIKKINIKKNKIYLLGYNNESSGSKNSEINYLKELEKFNEKYNCEYEFITIDEIYKVKAIIIDNIGIYLSTLGY